MHETCRCGHERSQHYTMRGSEIDILTGGKCLVVGCDCKHYVSVYTYTCPVCDSKVESEVKLDSLMIVVRCLEDNKTKHARHLSATSLTSRENL